MANGVIGLNILGDRAFDRNALITLVQQLQPAYVVCMNNPALAAELQTYTTVIARRHPDDSAQDNTDPIEFVRSRAPEVPKGGYLYLGNEPQASKKLNDWTVTALHAAHDLGIKCCILNLATGNPEPQDWEVLTPCIDLNNVYGGLNGVHAYWMSAPNTSPSYPYHVGRYFDIAARLGGKWVVTETGGNQDKGGGIPDPYAGWLTYLSEDTYADHAGILAQMHAAKNIAVCYFSYPEWDGHGFDVSQATGNLHPRWIGLNQIYKVKATAEPTPLPTPTFAPTIDVSEHQGVIDWQKVFNSGVKGAFIRSTMGKAGIDAKFAQNAIEAPEKGIQIGFYHLIRPEWSGEEQARFFWSTVGDLNFKALAVDVEISGTTAKQLYDFLEWLRREHDVRCWVYTSQGAFNQLSAEYDPVFATYPLWVANYTTRPTPALPRAWKEYILWQYSSTGQIEGIVGDVDLDRPPSSEPAPYPPGSNPSTKLINQTAGLKLRAAPSTSGTIIAVMPYRSEVTVYATPIAVADGYNWQRVKWGDKDGWAASAVNGVLSFVDPETQKFTMIHPVDCDSVISSKFNVPRDYDGDGIFDDKHEGTDFAPAHKNCTPLIKAGADGVVYKVSTTGAYGEHVILEHTVGSDVFRTWYCHLQMILVEPGERVKAGGFVGIMGSTGNSTGMHLHLNVQHIGKGGSGYVIADAVNPELYLVSP